MNLNFPNHRHPHGVDALPQNEYRIWVCTECFHIFTDSEIRNDGIERRKLRIWGHCCKAHPCRKEQRCESHLEPYKPDRAVNNER